MPPRPRNRLTVGLVMLAMMLASALPVRAQVALTVNRCLAYKIRTVGKSLAARTSCASKEAQHGTADPACHQKASNSFSGGATPAAGAFEKLEAKLVCLTTDDQATFESAIVAHAANVVAITGSAPFRCDAAKIRCIGRYVAAITTCDAKAAGKYGVIGLECTSKAAAKLANGASGCLDKAAAQADCSNAGSQVAMLKTAADDFLHDSVCALDPANPGCTPPALRYHDNGDGTVTDFETSLMWEQKTGSAAGFTDCATTACPDPHAATNAYQWCADLDDDHQCDDIFLGGFPVYPPNGGAFLDFIPAVNAGGGLAGHTDWRVPSHDELQAILLAPFICASHPCIDAAFGPTPSARYWVSDDYIGTGMDFSNAWFVDFNNGYVEIEDKTLSYHVRAVRHLP